MRHTYRSDWSSMGAEEQKALQVHRLREFLQKQLIPFHPYYQNYFKENNIDLNELRTLEDMKILPFSNKSLVAPTMEAPDRPRSFILQPTPETIRESLSTGEKIRLLSKKFFQGAESVKEEIAREYRPIQVFFTTGRTALPTSFVLSQYDWEILEECGRRIAEIVSINPAEDRVVSMFPYAPHLAFWQVQAVCHASGAFTLQTGGGKVMGTEGILRLLAKMKPSNICGIPGYVYHAVRQAVEEKIDLSNIRTVFLGGDRIVPGFRVKLKELLMRGGAKDPRIVSVFGFTESRKCWAECRKGGEAAGLHTYPDLEIFEVIDPDTGEILPEGETGELVYTPIDGRGSLILRYRTGDIVNGGITREACPGCGRIVPRISSNLSRASNITDFKLAKIKGSLVNLNLFSDILNGHSGVDEWQLVIAKADNDPFGVDEIRLTLAVCEGQDGSSVANSLEEEMKKACELRPNEIEFVDREELLTRLGMETNLKENRIVDLRDKAEATEEASKGASSS